MERIGRDLHDNIGQILSGVGLQLEALRLDFEHTPGLSQRLTDLQSMLERAMKQARDMSTELNPSVVERAGLHYGLEGLLDRYRTIFPGPLRLRFDPAIHLPREIGKAFYRVAEYTLEHAARRGGATQIEIQVKAPRGVPTMEIRHDGVTPPPAADGRPGDRVELLMLHYHAQRAGVPVSIESSAGKGTIVKTSYAKAAEQA